MRVVNIMLSRGRGGIEQAFVDYCRALSMRGHEVLAVTHPDAWVSSAPLPASCTRFFLSNFGMWDPFAPPRLERALSQFGAEIVLCHGNRAITFARRAVKPETPVVGLAHNYKIKRFIHLDAVFVPTVHLYEAVKKSGVAVERIFLIPNMIERPQAVMHPLRRTPATIGAMGRFVHKKGFHIFLQALALLRDRNFTFKAILGGDGEEHYILDNLITKLQLQDHVILPGWIDDKPAFFNAIDIFCLPSLHEPFGIVLLEAFAHHVTVVTTATEGPSEIAENGKNALIVPVNDPSALADALQLVIEHPERAAPMVVAAAATLEKYSIHHVSEQISDTLRYIVTHHTAPAP